jgi:hypothetical protein
MTANLETFVVRARRVAAHSLASDDKLINSLQSGETKFLIPSDGGDATIIVEVPPEEQMESLAARVRPVILESEDTYYAKALEAIGYLGGELNPEAVRVRRVLKKAWRDIDDKAVGVRGYSMQKRDSDGEYAASDNLLAWAWFYGDVVHASSERLALTDGFEVFDRYRAACMLVARITFLTLRTCDLVRALCEEGVLELSPRVFEVEVTVTETRKERPGQVRYAPVGTAEPAGIDEPFGPKWQTFTADDAAKVHEARKGET